MEVIYERQRNKKGELYTKWIIPGLGKSGSCKTQARAEKRVMKILNNLPKNT